MHLRLKVVNLQKILKKIKKWEHFFEHRIQIFDNNVMHVRRFTVGEDLGRAEPGLWVVQFASCPLYFWRQTQSPFKHNGLL